MAHSSRKRDGVRSRAGFAGPARPHGRALVGWRRVVFPLAAVALSVGLLALLEVGLRAAGVGYATSFFIEAQGRASGVLVSNPRFGWRFFPPPLARTPLVLSVTRDKPPRTFRLVVFGESAAMGTPEPAFSFARLLEAMLAEAFPTIRIEVINTAMTAINSHVVRAVAHESVALRPDLILIYMGNNEVVGPYGPGTVFGRAGAAWPLVRWDIWVRGTRTGQLVGRLLDWTRPAGPPRFEWRGLEMFTEQRIAADDPRLQGVYENFRRNLAAIVEGAQRAGIEVILSTVATNLADSPPFASLHRPGLSHAQRLQWEAWVREGAAHLAAARPAEALDLLGRAARLDDRPAELHFLLGRAYARLGRMEEARRAFEEARDLDALRFRADSRLNDVVRQVATSRASRGVGLLDVERLLVEELGGAPDERVFWDHVHFTFEGNYRVARVLFPPVAEQVERRLGVQRVRAALSLEECAARLAFTDWDRFRLATAALEMVRRPPFTAQLDHAARLARRRAEALAWRRRAEATLPLAERQYREALARRPEDLLLRVNFAQLLRERGKVGEAAGEWRRLLHQVPGVAEWRAQLALALAEEARASQPPDLARERQARELLEALVREEPDLPATHLNLGNLLRQMGEVDEALAHYREALRLNPGYELARLNLAALLADRGALPEAVGVLREGLALDPQSADLRARLATLLDRQGDLDAAIEEYRRALALDPDLAGVRNNLAYALERQGRLDEALGEYRRAVASDPTYALAHLNLADLLLRQGQLVEAVASLRKAVDLAPDHAAALNALAWVLATARDPTVRNPVEAVRLAERAAALTGGTPEVLRTLAAAYAARGRFDEAARTAAEARDRAAQRGDAPLAARLADELRTYRARTGR